MQIQEAVNECTSAVESCTPSVPPCPKALVKLSLHDRCFLQELTMNKRMDLRVQVQGGGERVHVCP